MRCDHLVAIQGMIAEWLDRRRNRLTRSLARSNPGPDFRQLDQVPHDVTHLLKQRLPFLAAEQDGETIGPIVVPPDGQINHERVDDLIDRLNERPQRPTVVEAEQHADVLSACRIAGAFAG